MYYDDTNITEIITSVNNYIYVFRGTRSLCLTKPWLDLRFALFYTHTYAIDIFSVWCTKLGDYRPCVLSHTATRISRFDFTVCATIVEPSCFAKIHTNVRPICFAISSSRFACALYAVVKRERMMLLVFFCRSI